MAIRPIFVLSLPRSGSTFLQSLLAASPQVGTAPEPWFQLHLAALDGAIATHAPYNARIAEQAVADLQRIASPGSLMGHGARSFSHAVYERLAPGALYFVDKTPRYSAIARWLSATYPDAAFVVLLRDPRDVIASMIETWGRSRWNVFLYEFDLVDAARESASFLLTDPPNTAVVRYEDLVTDPADSLAEISRILDVVELLAVERVDSDSVISGRMGDQTGRKKYGGDPSVGSVGRWVDELTPFLRSGWTMRYLTDSYPDELAAYHPVQPMIEELRRLRRKPKLTDITDLALLGIGEIWQPFNRLCGYKAEEWLRHGVARRRDRRREPPS